MNEMGCFVIGMSGIVMVFFLISGMLGFTTVAVGSISIYAFILFRLWNKEKKLQRI